MTANTATRPLAPLWLGTEFDAYYALVDLAGDTDASQVRDYRDPWGTTPSEAITDHFA